MLRLPKISGSSILRVISGYYMLARIFVRYFVRESVSAQCDRHIFAA